MKIKVFALALSVVISFSVTSSVSGMKGQVICVEQIVQGMKMAFLHNNSIQNILTQIETSQNPLTADEFGNTFLHFFAQKDDCEDEPFIRVVAGWLVAWTMIFNLEKNPDKELPACNMHSKEDALTFFKGLDAETHQYLQQFLTTKNNQEMTPFAIAYNQSSDGVKTKFLGDVMAAVGIQQEAQSSWCILS